MNKQNTILLLLIWFLFSANISWAQCPTLVWSDEFSGTTLDTQNWNVQTGDGCVLGICGWGNNELQSYQNANIAVDNGTLKITARRVAVDGKEYTSARINTEGKRDFTYGRFDARIKLPQGGGLWPAFWMLSTPEPYGGWPQSGEIDIMEFVGNEPTKTLGVIHYGLPFPDNQNQGTSFELNSGNFFDEWHVFSVEWVENEIRWFVDGNLFQVKRNTDVAPLRWPFDHDFHFLLNVAVGGNLGGQVDNTIFPATMEVDYVRVYDLGGPFISGSRSVENAETGVVYTIGNATNETMVDWTLPEGASIMAGENSAEITVDWGTSLGGDITAVVSSPCGTDTLKMNVFVTPPFNKTFSFENFDDFTSLAFVRADGSLSEVANPDPNEINSSATVGQYDRNSGAQFDVLNYRLASIVGDAADYVNDNRRFYMDVYTSAAVGTQIIIQLETANAASDNFPTGRHSRYFARVEQQNAWHRLVFDFLDRPDPNVSGSTISNMIVLFNPDSFSGDTYFFDNLDSYAAEGFLVTSLLEPEEGIQNTALDLESYPNPFNGVFNLDVTLQKPGSVSANIYDSEGRIMNVVRFSNLESGEHKLPIDLSGNKAGLYLIRVQAEGKMQTIKLLKE